MKFKMGRKIYWLLAGSILLSPWLAQARTHNLGFGLRAGMGLDPDQFVVGAQFSMGKSIGIFRFVPSVDVGFGSNLTVFNLNADFLLRLLIRDTPLELYGGAGPTLVFWDFKGTSAWEKFIDDQKELASAGDRVIFEVKPGAKILTVRSKPQYLWVWEEYFYQKDWMEEEGIFYFDWEAISKKYDAFNFGGGHYTSQKWYALEGWDVESTVWFNPSFLEFKGIVPKK